MKHFSIFLIFFLMFSVLHGQEKATFEELDPGPSGYWNGSDLSGKFRSGPFTFHNSYNPDWASWAGFSYTNHTDTVTAGWSNLYSAITGIGAGGSEVYATAFVVGSAHISLEQAASVSGMYITNSTYAYLSILNGDDFTKKFGGPDGTDPDYFRLIIDGIDSEGDTTGTVIFYLADFRDSDSENDYIIKDWTWVDLTTLGEVSEIHFSMESSDTGDWGMNNPAFFCVDNLNSKELSTNRTPSSATAGNFLAYPNPFSNRLSLTLPQGDHKVEIFDMQGRVHHHSVYRGESAAVIEGLDHLPSGVYIIRITGERMEYSTIKLRKH
jgi:hypothetical protein